MTPIKEGTPSRSRLRAGEGRCFFAHEFADALHDILGLRFGEFGLYCQGESLFCGTLTLGKSSWLVSEIGKAFLKVQGHRIVNLGADATLLQVALQFVAPRSPNHVLIEDVAVRLYRWQH